MKFLVSFLFQEFVYYSWSTSGFPKSVVLLKNLMKFMLLYIRIEICFFF